MKSTRFLLLIVALALVATGCGRYLQASAAVVDGKPITMEELDARVDAALPKDQPVAAEQRLEAQRRELSQMIQDRIIEFEANRQKIQIPAKDIEDRYQQVRGQFPSEQEFEDALRQQGIQPDDVRPRIRLRLVVEQIQKSIAEDIKIADVDVRNVYGRGERYEEANIRHILISVESPEQDVAAFREAQAALKRIRAGEDFAAVAKEVSDDPGSKAQGGALGWTARGRTVPEFEQAAFALKPGQISEPVRSQFGYHIIQTLQKRKKTLKQVEAEIKEQLSQERAQQAFQDFLSERVEEADVQVNPRFGTFNAESFEIEARRFYEPASPEPTPEGIPGLQLPVQPAG